VLHIGAHVPSLRCMSPIEGLDASPQGKSLTTKAKRRPPPAAREKVPTRSGDRSRVAEGVKGQAVEVRPGREGPHSHSYRPGSGGEATTRAEARPWARGLWC
jgi:hypothetical protein